MRRKECASQAWGASKLGQMPGAGEEEAAREERTAKSVDGVVLPGAVEPADVGVGEFAAGLDGVASVGEKVAVAAVKARAAERRARALAPRDIWEETLADG